MLLLRTLVVVACLTIGLPVAHAQDGTPDAPVVDAAAWGPYVRLVERGWQLGEGYRVTWEWLSPGEELREQWINPHDGKVVQTNVIRPGDTRRGRTPRTGTDRGPPAAGRRRAPRFAHLLHRTPTFRNRLQQGL